LGGIFKYLFEVFSQFSLSLREEYDSKGGMGMRLKKNFDAAEKLCIEGC